MQAFTRVYELLCAQVCVHVCDFVSACVCVYKLVCTCVWIHACAHVSVWVGLCVCTCVLSFKLTPDQASWSPGLRRYFVERLGVFQSSWKRAGEGWICCDLGEQVDDLTQLVIYWGSPWRQDTARSRGHSALPTPSTLISHWTCRDRPQ